MNDAQRGAPVIVPSPLDALLPPEMARRAEEVGAAKASMDGGRLLALAVLAGAFIALGGIFSTVALAGTNGAPWGATRVLVARRRDLLVRLPAAARRAPWLKVSRER